MSSADIKEVVKQKYGQAASTGRNTQAVLRRTSKGGKLLGIAADDGAESTYLARKITLL